MRVRKVNEHEFSRGRGVQYWQFRPCKYCIKMPHKYPFDCYSKRTAYSCISDGSPIAIIGGVLIRTSRIVPPVRTVGHRKRTYFTHAAGQSPFNHSGMYINAWRALKEEALDEQFKENQRAARASKARPKATPRAKVRARKSAGGNSKGHPKPRKRSSRNVGSGHTRRRSK